MDKVAKPRISGKEATYVAMSAAKYPPVHISEADKADLNTDPTGATAQIPVPIDGTGDGPERRKAPPRVRKPSPMHNQYLAPTPDPGRLSRPTSRGLR